MRSVAAFCGILALMATAGAGAGAPPRNEEPLVDVARAGRGIRIELRYATRDNITREPLYPQSARCLLRASVVERLRRAQMSLKRAGAGLKIWDAYRPPWAQRILWNRAPHPQFVGDPARGGSLHTWGVAVDVTLVDALGRELKMPSAFDDFSQAAARRYSGKDEAVSRNLRLLQNAMTSAGFLVMRDEWWHFVAADYREFAPVDAPLAP